MEKPNSYENVMRELEELNDLLESGDLDVDVCDPDDGDFKFEYAHEALTQRNTSYRRRNGDA